MSKISISLANNCASRKGKYSFNSVLGEGSFGVVFLADDVEEREQVAIKIIGVRDSVLDVLLRRRRSSVKVGEAKQEVDILVRLTHDNIVALKDYFEFQEGRVSGMTGLAMVMEYCPNGNLQEYLSKMASLQERFPLTKRKQWYTQMSTALQFIHSQGIIHRDLKPPNILLDANDNLKIADVGLARTVWELKSHTQELSKDTTFNQYMSSLTGTPVYMAPEVWEGHYNASSDVFSMGLMFVMIAVVPNPPIPYGYWDNENDCLGKLLSDEPSSRTDTPTNLITGVTLSHLSSTECRLLDGMLVYDYHARLSVEQVMESIKGIERRRSTIRQTIVNRTEEGNSNNEENGWNCVIL